MIVDTSVWVDSLRRVETRHTLVLWEEQTAGRRVALLPVIYQEVLQGARSIERLRRLDHEFSGMPIEMLPDQMAVGRLAAELYARCRWNADTVRSGVDCIIAASCVLLDLPLLHSDGDFEFIRKIEPRLQFVPVPPP